MSAYIDYLAEKELEMMNDAFEMSNDNDSLDKMIDDLIMTAGNETVSFLIVD